MNAHQAIDAMRHRGPDATGIWTSPSHTVTLAHARLATIDLSNGRQPLANEDATVVAVVNGEFYETGPIRSYLETCGHRFKTGTDSEILIHLYEQCGIACLSQLQGEFAFVLWDETKRRLFAARDRFGAKPLFYSDAAGGLSLASEVKVLQRAGLPLSWDEQGFYEQFAFQSSLQGRTLYQGIRQLSPGHCLLRTEQSFEVSRYWDLNYPLEADSPAQSDEAWAAQLGEALYQAVSARMQADVPVACYLSGGIDSNSILGLMMSSPPAPGSVSAFCASFDTPELDEFDVAARSAACLGARLTRVPVTSEIIASDFRRTIWHCESLIGNANSVAKFALSRAVREAGFKVVLTGEGADELFAGYPNLVADSLRGMLPAERLQLRSELGINDAQLQAILNPLANPLSRTASKTVLDRLGYSPMWLDVRHWVMEQFASVLPGAYKGEEMDRRLLDSLPQGQIQGRSVLNKSCYIHSKTCLAGVTLCSLGDRVEMAHSIESRLPFLDHRVVEVARRAPASQKVRRGAEKFILRKAMRQIVPPEICGRRKHPITAPPALWQPCAFGQLLQDTLRSRHLQSIPFVDAKALIALLDDMASKPPATRNTLETPLIALASACVLAEEFSLS